MARPCALTPPPPTVPALATAPQQTWSASQRISVHLGKSTSYIPLAALAHVEMGMSDAFGERAPCHSRSRGPI